VPYAARKPGGYDGVDTTYLSYVAQARLSKVQADSTRQLSGDAAAAKTTPASKQARSKEKQEVGEGEMA
jgi:hypothetical protein